MPWCCRSAVGGRQWKDFPGFLDRHVPFHFPGRQPGDVVDAAQLPSRRSPLCPPLAHSLGLPDGASVSALHLCPKSATAPEAIWTTVEVVSLPLRGLLSWWQHSWVGLAALPVPGRPAELLLLGRLAGRPVPGSFAEGLVSGICAGSSVPGILAEWQRYWVLVKAH